MITTTPMVLTHCFKLEVFFTLIEIKLYNTMLKSMRMSKNRYFYHISVSPGDAPGGITLNVVSMERNSMLTNCLIECGHLTITVSEIEIY